MVGNPLASSCPVLIFSSFANCSIIKKLRAGNIVDMVMSVNWGIYCKTRRGLTRLVWVGKIVICALNLGRRYIPCACSSRSSLSSEGGGS